jgi:sirohydrochlorin cobaltochelatase
VVVSLEADDRTALDVIEERLRLILPEDYQGAIDAVAPRPMRSAPLRYGPDGQVAWDAIWGSFCDLAMAGGPPHKGAWLEPATPDQVAAEPDRHEAVVHEIRRGIGLATELEAKASPRPGWVRVSCLGPGMAGWLLRAIVMENVAARAEGSRLDLPASPRFRLEKETKNVVTVIAKTCHYWQGHMPRTQRDAITAWLAEMQETAPLIEPDAGEAYLEGAAAALAQSIETATGLPRSHHRYRGWVGLTCASVRSAVWMMRALVASNVLARREDTALLVPVNPASDPDGRVVAEGVARVLRLERARPRG